MSAMRVSDVIMDYFVKLGINDVFMVTGGGAMFLNDAVALNGKLRAVCNHHEQASAMAAVGYAKYRNSYGAAVLSTGCGSTNAITGLLDAWQDNVPCFFVSGQVKRRETSHNANVPLRQFGVQEANIIKVVDSLTKYAVMINKPEEILYHLEKAAFLAVHGRPGPVWIDVPLDMQGATVDINELKHFDSSEFDDKCDIGESDLSLIYDLLKESKRPIIVAGNGVRLGHAVDEFRNFIEKSKIPVAVSYLGVDFLPSNHPQYVGRMGVKGDRAGNFAVQNADLVITFGTRLSVAMTGFEYDLFAREAKIVVVDIDPYEHQKKTVRIDHFINADVKDLLIRIDIEENIQWKNWGETCKKWRDIWPITLPEHMNDKDGVNKYCFMDVLSKNMNSDSVVVSDAGSSYYVVSQALKISNIKQRYITSGAQADMGFTLPAAIGVCVARNNHDVIGITGDGSFQMNIQELQTIAHYKQPVKLVVWNNHGYLSIRATQNKFFEGREIGTDEKSGVSFPECKKIADAYGIHYIKMSNIKELNSNIKELIDFDGPVICEVICPENQEIIPTVSSLKLPDGRMVSKPIEDMYPFLEREVFYNNMIVTPVEE